jgi:hypothetical protein
VSTPLSIDQEARVLSCRDNYDDAVVATLGRYPRLDDRMVRRPALEAVARDSGQPVAVFVAWLHRVITDPSVRPLDADLDLRWPASPDPDDAALVVALVTDPRCWYYEVRVALLLAERVLEHGPPPVALVDGLLALRARLEDDRLHGSEFFRAKALPWLLRLVAETTPQGVVDLAFVDDRDRWAPLVAEIVGGAADPASTARALMHLGSPRGGKPSQVWWSRTTTLLADAPGLAAVADAVLDAVTTVDTTPRDQEHDGWDVPDPFLLTPTNELIARGAAWALRIPPASVDRCALLGRVVLRSAAMVWVVPAHRMLCPKLASATVDTLIALDTPAAREQLMDLVGEIRVAPLIRRISPHLGVDADALVASLRQRGPLPRPDR